MNRYANRSCSFLKRGLSGLVVVGIALLGFAGPALAQGKTLAEELRGQRGAIALAEGRLTGPGADTLRRASADVQFVVVGEDHGVAEIADFCAAYFEELATRGFETLGLEVGPAAAAALGRALAQPKPLEAVAAFEKANPFSLAFYDMNQEATLLVRLSRAIGPRLRLWGFDQELMGAGGFLLKQMSAEPVNAGAARQIKEQLAKEAEAYARASESGRPDLLYMMTAALDDLEALRRQLQGPREKAALALLEGLLESRRIYEKNMTGEGYDSNVQRARLMKRTVGAELAGDPGRKALIKVGAYHAYRGVNPLGSRELGNFLSEHAEGRGAESLHVLVLAEHGRQLRFAGIGRPMVAGEIEPITGKSPLAGVLPIFEAAAGNETWSLFDLRPLRPRGASLSAGTPEFQRLLHGFDFVLIIPLGTPSREL